MSRSVYGYWGECRLSPGPSPSCLLKEVGFAIHVEVVP